MSEFETHPKSLKTLLEQINNRELVLPNFQRDFVWDPGATEELIESIMNRFPAGSLLFLQHSGKGFDVRVFDGASSMTPGFVPNFLVLDGQQRLTSLYQAFYGKGDHRFFLYLKPLIEGSGDIEEAVWHESFKRAERRGYTSIEEQAENLIFPLERLLGSQGGFYEWLDEVAEERQEPSDEAKELKKKLMVVYKKWMEPIVEYKFPVVTLDIETSMAAVCKVFETLNRRGVKLTVFELLMARSFSQNVSLRNFWDAAIKDNPILEEFDVDPYYILQTISLVKQKSIKRTDVLDLKPDIIQKQWDETILGFVGALEFLRAQCGILVPGLLPYMTMTVPMAAIWIDVLKLKGPAIGAAKKSLTQWFWASVFTQAYERGPSSRAVSDFKELHNWIFKEGEELRSLKRLYFQSSQFLDILPKQRALYRGTLALTASDGLLDFHNGEIINHEYYDKNKVDDHHIFPVAFMKSKVSSARIECVVNKTLLDKMTNIRISAKAPSRYLKEMAKELGEKELQKVLKSHFLSYEFMSTDNFKMFLDVRAEKLLETLSERLGRPIPSTPPELESDSEDDVEDDEEANPRDRVDPSLVNQRPIEALAQSPAWVTNAFDTLLDEIKTINSNIWWKNHNKLTFYSPQKNFMRMRFSRTGIRLRLFTRGQSMTGVDPIINKSRGGELWGRFAISDPTKVKEAAALIQQSWQRMNSALEAGESTAWWALRNKEE